MGKGRCEGIEMTWGAFEAKFFDGVLEPGQSIEAEMMANRKEAN